MSKADYMTFEGEVTDVLPNNTFKVKIEERPEPILTYLSGKMRQHKIKVILGDKVDVEMTPYDLTRGRISFRYR